MTYMFYSPEEAIMFLLTEPSSKAGLLQAVDNDRPFQPSPF